MVALFVKRNSKKIVVCNKIVFRNNVITRGFGLQFHRRIIDEAHVFLFKTKKKVAVTMLFVFFPIDVLFLDEKKRIVEIKENFKPFTNYWPAKECLYVVEIPQGTVKKQKLNVKDVLEF